MSTPRPRDESALAVNFGGRVLGGRITSAALSFDHNLLHRGRGDVVSGMHQPSQGGPSNDLPRRTIL